jgi:hypothetical protein
MSIYIGPGSLADPEEDGWIFDAFGEEEVELGFVGLEGFVLIVWEMIFFWISTDKNQNG